MRIAVLGTGMVGQAIGRKLVALGHEVRMGSRTADNEKATGFTREAGAGASNGTFADAAAFGETVFNCTKGEFALQALEMAGPALAGKVLVDVSNPLDFSQGFPPYLSVSNTDSMAETIQRAFPDARVVKALNTVNASVMVDPGRIPGPHATFVCGDDPDAKEVVVGLLRELGWEQILDLGKLSAARGTEAYLLLWTRLFQATGGPDFNIAVVQA